MAITRKDTAALAGASAEEPVAEEPRPLFISEGVRQDLEIHGKAVDPATGDALELNRETGEVTATPRVPE